MKKLFLLFLLLCSNSYGQTITGVTTVPEHTLVVLTVVSPENVKVTDIDWEVDYVNDSLFLVSKYNSCGSLVFTGPVGNYKVRAWITIDGKGVHRTNIVTIRPKDNLDPKPIPPNPEPSPEPKPEKVIPNDQKLQIFAIFDFDSLVSLPPGQLAVKNSNNLGDTLLTFNSEWYLSDIKMLNQDPRWSPYLKDKKAPLLVIINGKNTFNYPMPNGEAEVINLVKKLRGIK